jgi:hypothetical protein
MTPPITKMLGQPSVGNSTPAACAHESRQAARQ